MREQGRIADGICSFSAKAVSFAVVVVVGIRTAKKRERNAVGKRRRAKIRVEKEDVIRNKRKGNGRRRKKGDKNTRRSRKAKTRNDGERRG